MEERYKSVENDKYPPSTTGILLNSTTFRFFLRKKFGQVDKNLEICGVIQHYHTQTQQITPTSS